MDHQWHLGWFITFFVLVDPYPFTAIKKVWIDQNKTGYGSTKMSLTVHIVHPGLASLLWLVYVPPDSWAKSARPNIWIGYSYFFIFLDGGQGQMSPLPEQFLRPCYDAAFRAEMYLGCKSAQSHFIFRAPAIFLQLYCNLCAKSADEICLITILALNYLVLAGGKWGCKIGIWLWFIFIIY